jgi:hypothetical protein
MMEAYSEWNLLYRTPEEIRAFANSLPEAEFTVSMIDESGARLSETGPSTIAFLDIRRC